METIENSKAIMKLYIDSANSYIQLSIGVLILSVVFKEKILGEIGHFQKGGLLIVSWIFLLVSIGAASLYQYLAIKYLEIIYNLPRAKGILPEYIEQKPGVIYGVMLICFYSGAIFFVASAARRLFKKNDNKDKDVSIES
jgi:hypothetical protein